MTKNSQSPRLKLYRASAGSGKTYRLSLEFLKLLIHNPFCYDKILAVTFTNKATTEMQTRIMADLYSVAKGLDTGLINHLKKELNKEASENGQENHFSDQLIKNNAQKALFKILHDYSHFQISTIDSFFQIILRNLAHELGLGAYINIVIESDDVLSDAIDLMKENFRTNAILRDRINEYSNEKTENNTQWRIDKDMFTIGKNIFREVFMENEKELEEKLRDPLILEKFKKEIIKLKKFHEKRLSDMVLKFDKILEDNGLTVDDLSSKAGGAYAYINSIKRKDYEPLEAKKKAMSCLEAPEKWASQKHPRQKEIIDLGEKKLNPLLLETEDIRKESIVHIHSCNSIYKQLSLLGFVSEIADEVKNVNQQRGQFLLSDTPSLLKSMIEDDDTPFIYEKIGTHLEHIMIDEFQDTSGTQWHNFKPLIKECMDQNNMNLIVGDPKQSIYRFRNGDWRIISHLDNAFTGITPHIINAEDNWRSKEVIIHFNNSIFAPTDTENSPILSPFLSLFGGHALLKSLNAIYQDSKQNCPKEENKDKGSVSVEFINASKDKEESEEWMLQRTVEWVTQLQEQGVKASDITILCKKTKHITKIAEYFAQYRDMYKEEIQQKGFCYDIISDEAYHFESSTALNMIINAMRVAVQPDDDIHMIELYSQLKARDFSFANLNYKEEDDYISLKTKIQTLKNIPLYEMVEELCRILHLDEMPDQTSFLSTFFDYLNEFISRKSPDLSRFIDYWENYLKNQKIPLADNAKGIHIMTIHKSKGLEFHTVIIPYCDWDLYGADSQKDLLWCKTSHLTPPYNQLPILPVNYQKELKESVFSDAYEEETIQQLVDNINLLYVAFTRAVNNLIVLCKKKEEKKDKKEEEETIPTTCSALLEDLLHSKLTIETQEPDESIVNCHYKIGTLLPSAEKATLVKSANPFKEKPHPIEAIFHTNRRTAKFRNSNKASEFIEGIIDAETKQSEAIKKGLLLHYLFSNINTEKDIVHSVQQLLVEGLISSEKEKYELIEYATEKIQQHHDWFREGLKLYKECSILSRDNQTGRVKISRPDRVIQEGNKMIIIDFKTGKETESNHKKYQKQVDEYAHLLQQMGYETETHIWYLNSEEES